MEPIDWGSVNIAHAGPTDLTLDPAKDLVELASGQYVPRRYTADIDDPRVPCEIILDVYVDSVGAPHCRGAQFLARPGEAGLGWDEVRVPMRALLERTMVWLAGPLRLEDGKPVLAYGAGANDPSIAEAIRSGRPRRERRDRVTEERLREVARLYREALKSAAPGVRSRPRKYIRERLAANGDFYSGDTIAKWVSAARDQGLLERAPRPGKAGEAKKARPKKRPGGKR